MKTINKYKLNLGWNEILLAQASDILTCTVAAKMNEDYTFLLWALIDDARLNETHHIFIAKGNDPLPAEFQAYKNYEHIGTEQQFGTSFHFFEVFCRKNGIKQYPSETEHL